MTTKSNGHIAFDRHGREWFEVNREVYVAPTYLPISTHGYRLGRWECSRSHFDRWRPELGESWGLP